MILTQVTHWSTIINVILHSYFSELTTTCILWHRDYELHLQSINNFNVLLVINPLTLNESFAYDIHNFSQQDERYKSKGITYDNWIKKLIAAIERTHCEGFLVFQNDIPKFAKTFRKASTYSIWRSIRSRFLLVYAKEGETQDYFEDLFFKNNANILVIEAAYKNSSQFVLKTNKFVGSLHDEPHKLIKLNTFDAITAKFESNIDLFSQKKLQDLQGREIIVGAFDYRPFVAVDYQRLPQYYDHADDNLQHLAHVDGTEVHITHTFCKIYNCTVQVDTTEKSEWGTVYPNYTGDGLIGMILEGKTHMGMGAMFSWDIEYAALDETTFLGRSGVTCLVPAPRRLTSWTLPLKPFQLTLWLAIFSCLILETIALLVSQQFEQNLVEQSHDVTWRQSIKFGYTTTLKLFVSQSSNYKVKSNTVRSILFACYMIDIIVTSIYGGGLAAILTMPTLDEAADSLERFYRHNLTWTASSYAWLGSLSITDAKELGPIFNRIVANFRVNSFDEMRSLAKTQNMAFALERLMYGHFGNSHYVTAEALQRLKLMLDDMYFGITVAMVPRLWAHLPKYNDLILAWHSSGLSKYWEWKITAEYLNANQQNQIENSKYTNSDIGPVKLDIENFAGIILLWLVGMAASILVFVGEIIVSGEMKRGE